MYSIIHLGRPTVARETFAAGAALVVAEVFYKFHSFSLECLAFLATWFAFSWIVSRVFPGSTKPSSLPERRSSS
ncbi:hypothetical protein BE04_11250 [Sorangium cellulosum]|uniref:Uncharacterized protein n=1 Tax=Sorangium cellulosum TaxID=56 RepID=A0A150PA25_SORCE|nr:hypothetical protein BE04_11250 [Sorangium cellulosum]